MSELLTLREAGRDYPDPAIMAHLNAITTRLGASEENQVFLNGGYVRDLLLLGHTRDVQDLDACMSLAAFLNLKPKEDGVEDIRKHFTLHPPHLLYMAHQIQDGIFEQNPRPLVLVTGAETLESWDLHVPLNLSLSRRLISPQEMAANADLGFSGVVSNGTEIWVTPAFLSDWQHQTITLTRCRDVRDYERTLKRIERFLATRYTGWHFVIPDHFRHFADKA